MHVYTSICRKLKENQSKAQSKNGSQKNSVGTWSVESEEMRKNASQHYTPHVSQNMLEEKMKKCSKFLRRKNEKKRMQMKH